MEVHRLVALLASVMLDKAGATTLDLDAATSLLLDVFNIGTTVADNLGAEVETRNGLEVDGDLLFGPFTLLRVSVSTVLSQYITLCNITLPYSSRSTCSGSLRRKRLSSTRLGSSCFISSSILTMAFSRPSLVVLVTWR